MSPKELDNLLRAISQNEPVAEADLKVAVAMLAQIRLDSLEVLNAIKTLLTGHYTLIRKDKAKMKPAEHDDILQVFGRIDTVMRQIVGEQK